MVYRDLSTDLAAQMYDELVRPKATEEKPPVKQKVKKVVKVLLPKS